MREQVRQEFIDKGEVSLPELIAAIDGTPGEIFLATRALYHEGTITRVGPGRYRMTDQSGSATAGASDTATEGKTAFEWGPDIESRE